MKIDNKCLQKGGIILRKARLTDTDAIFKNVWSDAEAATYMYWEPTANRAEADARMERTVAFEEKNPHCYFVALAETDEAIGFAGMVESAPGEYSEAGICIGKAFRRRGFARASLEILMQEAFETFGAERFVCSAMSGNTASRALIVSLGFREYEREAMIRPSDGAPETLIRFVLSRAEYLSRKDRTRPGKSLFSSS